MKLFDRIKTLLTADAHGVVESLEDRALMLKQCLRDARQSLGEKKARQAVLTAEAEGLARDITKLEERIAALDGDVALAMGNGEDDLARFAIRKLLPWRADHKELTARLEAVQTERASLAETLSEQQQALDELQARVRAHLAMMPEEGDAAGASRAVIADEEVELELLHRRQAMDKGAA